MFKVPIFQSEYSGDISKIKNEILSIKDGQKDTPLTMSNQNGYHSDQYLDKEEFMQPLLKWIASESGKAYSKLTIKKSRTEFNGCWFNVNTTLNSYNHIHTHNGILSGIFYVNAPPGSAKTYFYNMGMNRLWDGFLMGDKNEYNSAEHEIIPKTGMLYLFPSYIYHAVGTNDKEVERISISFNLR